MVAELTIRERSRAFLILVAMALVGLVMAVAGAHDPFGTHGILVLLFSLALLFVLMSGFFAPEPDAARLGSYYDDPSKAGIVLAMFWAVVGMFVGDWIAWQMAFPDLRFDAAWSSFGRLRPVHTSGVIFGFGGNALIATSLH